jgi:phosphoesterase RecJ-like protein
MYPEAPQLQALITDAKRVLIMQADNPDGDSMGSALALEQIIGDMGKEPLLYCGVDIPSYLTYLKGWDRVSKDVPQHFDAAIIVDTSALSLFEQLEKSGQKGWVMAKPVIVLDHHPVENTLTFATVVCNHPVVATGELIYELGLQLQWPMNLVAKEMMAIAIMSDSLGLITEGTSARSIHAIAELVEDGVSLAKLENNRREMMRKSPELIKYKGELLQRVEYYADNRIAAISIPWREIEKYSQQYNPSMLVMDEMRGSIGTAIAIAFKYYNDGHITAKIRANYGYPIAGKLAEHFGGGGHPYASGFKLPGGKPFTETKAACIKVATELLDTLEQTQS